MTRFRLACAVFVGTLLCSCSAPPADSIQQLDSGWEARIGESLDPAGSDWRPVRAIGLSTERYGERIVERVQLPVFEGRDPTLEAPLVYQSFEVFVEGEPLPIYAGGNPALGARGYGGWPAHWISLKPEHSGRRLYFRIFSEGEAIGVVGPVRLGERSALYSAVIRRDIDRFALAALFIFAAVFATILYVRRRILNYVSFAFFSLCGGVYIISNRTALLQHLLYDRPFFWLALEFASLMLMPVGIAAYFEGISRFQKYFRALRWVHVAFAVGAGLLIAAGLPSYRVLFPFFYLTLFSMVSAVAALSYEALRGNQEARIIIAGALWFLAIAVYDVLGALSLITWPRQLIAWGLFGFLFSLGAVLERRFTRTYDQLHDYTENLERRVDERTQELRSSLEVVQALKDAQDGDYFLVSLLMKPLLAERHATERIQAEMLVRQNKRIQFRDREAVIGGDLCLARSFTAGGRTWLAFLNCDAMGKSIQGAGGALVAGVFFQSFFDRYDSHGAAIEPVGLLRQCYTELQQSFRPFEGMMMCTAILGLVDEADGRLHYVNAEHPALVLLRRGRASFIEPFQQADKIGMPGDAAHFAINEFLLETGDRVLAGSDGRDDILLGLSEDGKRVINSDRDLFLQTVEQCAGDLVKIEAALLQRGELTDDLSLLKISYSA